MDGITSGDPSRIAVYQTLIAQANGFGVAASGAQSATSALQELRSLAVEATDDFLSAGDRQSMEEQAGQLVEQIDTDAPAQATVTPNAPLAGGGNLVSSAVATGRSQGGTIALTAVAVPSGAGVDVRFTDSLTGQTTYLGVQAAGSNVNVLGTHLALGPVAAGDLGATAAVHVTSPAAAPGVPDLGMQTAAAEGSLVTLSAPVQAADPASSATNALGQLDAAVIGVSSASESNGPPKS